MPYSTLPLLPLAVFGVLEPVIGAWAGISALRDPYAWYMQKVPPTKKDENSLRSAVPFPPQAQVLTHQQGIGALIMSSASIVCCWSDSAQTARHFIAAIAVMDYVHIYATYLGVGPEVFWKLSEWNHMLWGDVAVTMGFNALRWSTVLGLFDGSQKI